MIFYKTNSFGNDFIEIAESELAYPTGRRPLGGLSGRETDKCLLARKICDGHRAVGADGVVFYRVEKQRFHFEIFNRDGGEAELSGNGMAGLAAVLFQRRLASSPLTLQGVVGKRRIDLLARKGPVFELNVEIGIPDLNNRKSFPFLKDKQDKYVIDGLEFYPVAVGNPHAVVICPESLDPGRLAALGEKIANHPIFPRRVNVEFVHFTNAVTCPVFFYERGVGPTQASSTGSAAVFAVLRRLGLVKDRLHVDCGADTIAVSWKQGIFIHNFTRLVCRGEYYH
jgi:diaminopimelate epimerase